MKKLLLTAVGLGPGDPELITVKGAAALSRASLIFVPQSTSGERSIALGIAKHYLNPRQRIISLPLPMTRNSAALNAAWRNAADTIAQAFYDCVEQLKQEQTTQNDHAAISIDAAYPLLGDPMLYGTFTYIWAALAEHYPDIQIKIIPGVTSFAVAAAMSQTPLAATSDRVAILPASYAHDDDDGLKLRQALHDFDTVILMKAGPALPKILPVLHEMGLLATTVYAERLGLPEERLISNLVINPLPIVAAPYLSLLIVRKITPYE
ncbi:MAG: precorrin-2 C(20)-methyltransferase [Anaerolineae bacterium]|nr:precorrin-2 C(20)-methyltransferase [Anaerolineae bacterium]